MTGVLRGFLGTYVSRYSDFDGYLLFGFVADSLAEREIDLTGDDTASYAEDPARELASLARRKFKEQLSKVGLPDSIVRSAVLVIRRGPERTGGVLLTTGATVLSGFDLTFAASAVTDLGGTYSEVKCVFIAPQDPALFARSGRARRVCLTTAST